MKNYEDLGASLQTFTSLYAFFKLWSISRTVSGFAGGYSASSSNSVKPIFLLLAIAHASKLVPGKYIIGQPHFQAYIPLKVSYQKLAGYRS